MISFSDFLSQLLFSSFEVVSSAVILLFGWYFARVIGWYSAKYFGGSRFYASLQRLKWLNRWTVRVDLPRVIEEIIKWWILLAFVAVSAAIVGFGPVSQFLGKLLEDFARVLLSVLVFASAALVADHFPKIMMWRFLRRLRQPLFWSRAAVFATWVLAVLVVAFIAKLIKLKNVIDWGGIAVILAIVVALAVEIGSREWAGDLASRAAKRLKFKRKA